MSIAKSATVHQFPQAYNYYNNNQESNSTQSNYYYNSELPQLMAVYHQELGYPMPPAVQRQCVNLLNLSECTPGLIAAVIEYTAVTAPRPSWPYARSVINAQMKAGVYTAEAFEAACDAFRAKRARVGSKRVIEQEYSQREYGPELDGPSEEDIRAAAAL